MGYRPRGHKESDTTEQITHTCSPGLGPVLTALVLLPPSPVKWSLSQQMNKRIQEKIGRIQWEPGKNFFFFLMWTIFKVFIEFVIILLMVF